MQITPLPRHTMTYQPNAHRASTSLHFAAQGGSALSQLDLPTQLQVLNDVTSIIRGVSVPILTTDQDSDSPKNQTTGQVTGHSAGYYYHTEFDVKFTQTGDQWALNLTVTNPEADPFQLDVSLDHGRVTTMTYSNPSLSIKDLDLDAWNNALPASDQEPSPAALFDVFRQLPMQDNARLGFLSRLQVEQDVVNNRHLSQPGDILQDRHRAFSALVTAIERLLDD